MSKHTNRDYGSDIILIQEYKLLRKRVEDYSWSSTKTETGESLNICSKPNFFIETAHDPWTTSQTELPKPKNDFSRKKFL